MSEACAASEEERRDIRANNFADEYAKLGAKTHTISWPVSAMRDVLAEAKDQAGIIKAIGQMLALYPSARVLWPRSTTEFRMDENACGMEAAETMFHAAGSQDVCEAQEDDLQQLVDFFGEDALTL